MLYGSGIMVICRRKRQVLTYMYIQCYSFYRVTHTPSGRVLDMHTTEPGMQLYTAFYVDGQPAKGGVVYQKYSGFTTEAQHYPNSPNEV